MNDLKAILQKHQDGDALTLTETQALVREYKELQAQVEKVRDAVDCLVHDDCAKNVGLPCNCPIKEVRLALKGESHKENPTYDPVHRGSPVGTPGWYKESAIYWKAQVEKMQAEHKAIAGGMVSEDKYDELLDENEALQAQVENMNAWLVDASVCPGCGDSPLRAHYSGGVAIRKYCNSDKCDWQALKGENDESR